ncbi:MAG: hypothetical protein EOP56_18060 [Sphingobacteriales bacterium]|nr:MAG: hypothetical protein EOP56_18060 [Sphingobacteriales bacterium]
MTTTNSNNNGKGLLNVVSFAPGTVSGQLYAYCTDSRFPMRKALTRITVNYNAFKEFVEDEMAVPNFGMWYIDNYKGKKFVSALTFYVNQKTGRIPYQGLTASLRIAQAFRKNTQLS